MSDEKIVPNCPFLSCLTANAAEQQLVEVECRKEKCMLWIRGAEENEGSTEGNEGSTEGNEISTEGNCSLNIIAFAVSETAAYQRAAFKMMENANAAALKENEANQEPKEEVKA